MQILIARQILAGFNHDSIDDIDHRTKFCSSRVQVQITSVSIPISFGRMFLPCYTLALANSELSPLVVEPSVLIITSFTSSISGAGTSITLRGFSNSPLNSGGRTSRSKLNDGDVSSACVTASENLAGCAVDRTTWWTSGGLQLKSP